MKDRRPIGFESTVSAVRPSISSEIDVLAAQTAWTMPRIIIRVSPESLSILMSSPKVLYGIHNEQRQTERHRVSMMIIEQRLCRSQTCTLPVPLRKAEAQQNAETCTTETGWQSTQP